VKDVIRMWKQPLTTVRHALSLVELPSQPSIYLLGAGASVAGVSLNSSNSAVSGVDVLCPATTPRREVAIRSQ
jgi:hypothetical protein